MSIKGLVINYGEEVGVGGLQNGRRWNKSSFTNTNKRGVGEGFSHAEGGSQKVLR